MPFGATRIDGIHAFSFTCPSANHIPPRTSFFLIGFYTFSLVCFVLIAKFGILPAINPPNKTLQGMFVLACAISGIMGGALSIFFWKGTKYFIGAWGGFAFGLWIQCFKNGGAITPVGTRWIMYICQSTLSRPRLSLTCPFSVRCPWLCSLHRAQDSLAHLTAGHRIRRVLRFHPRCRLLHHCWPEGGMSSPPPQGYISPFSTSFMCGISALPGSSQSMSRTALLTP